MTNNNTNDTKILDLNQTMNDFIVGLMKQTMERLMHIFINPLIYGGFEHSIRLKKFELFKIR